MKEVALELDAELPCTVVSPVLLPDPRVEEATDPILARYGVTREEGGIHSGFVETSLLLASSYGHLVDMPAAERGFVGDVWARIEEAKKVGRWSMADITPCLLYTSPSPRDRS